MSDSSVRPIERAVLDAQREQWTRTFETRDDFMGAVPSEPANHALKRFRAASVRDLLELGPGQGRDTLFFAQAGLRVTALDYAQEGLDQVSRKPTSVRRFRRLTRASMPAMRTSSSAWP